MQQSTRPRLGGQSFLQPFLLADFICSVSLASVLALSVGLCAGPVSRGGMDAIGFLFLIVAFSYRGSRRGWWLVWAPLTLIVMFAPIARWESLQLLGTGGIMRASLIPGLSFIGGSLMAAVRDTLGVANDAGEELRRLHSRTFASLVEINKMETQLTDIIFSKTSNVDPTPALSRIARSSAEGMSRSVTESEVMSHPEIHGVIASQVDAWSQTKNSVRIKFDASSDRPVPLAARGKTECLRIAVRDLLGLAIDSLSGGVDGFVRVGLRPGLRSVTITIEDNGRGLNEAKLIRLEELGLTASSSNRLGLGDLRALVEGVGWRLAYEARLGVGARATVEIPRVDAFAQDVSSRIQIRDLSLATDVLDFHEI